MKSVKRVVQIKIPEDTISLRLGQPSLSILPHNYMKEASESFFEKNDPRPFQYGLIQGDEEFRENLSCFVNKKTSTDISPENLIVTTGATNAIVLLTSILAKEGDTVFVEDPTYFIISKVLKNYNVNIVSIPCDRNGMRLDILEEKLKIYKPAFVYTIPTFQNPSSFTATENHRSQLIEICYKCSTYILADEVYHLLSYTAEPPMLMPAYDKYGIVLSINSFSKIFAPGVRLGWIQSRSTDMIKKITETGVFTSSGGLNPFTSAIANELIKGSHLERYIDFLKITYSKRMKILSDALDEHLSDFIEYKFPGGGYYIWAKLKNRVSSIKLEESCKEFKVLFLPGIYCSNDGNYEDHIRLCISYHNCNEITEGVIRIRKGFEKLLT